jgi:hypothetical protein
LKKKLIPASERNEALIIHVNTTFPEEKFAPVTERNERNATTWMNLETLMLSEGARQEGRHIPWFHL